MRLLLQSILIGWMALTFPLYSRGEVMATANWTQLSERSPFGVKPKKIVVQPEQAPVAKQVPVTIEFRGVAVTDERVYCILFDKAKNRGYSILVGDKSEEYYIEWYDERTQTISLSTPSGPVVLGLVDPTQSKTSDSNRSSYGFGGDDFDSGYNDPFSDPWDSGNGYGSSSANEYSDDGGESCD